ncbi:MAG: DUF58 domain-containing protein [Hyphomonadaceae bacterium]|nr:DUF58 domain-containing protein [Hyphomonadaceae bacterium]
MKQARAEAEGLAGFLPGVLLEARRLSAAAPGVHGRRRAGPGEAFWQFRDHRPEDGARLVDWRRSARGERLYVREREKEAAQSALFWVDPGAGFHWKSDGPWPTKHRRALALCLAAAILFARGGERVGALGMMPRAGARAVDRLAVDLAGQRLADPLTPPARSSVIYASDFYAPAELWRDRLREASATGATGALLMIADPAEEDFPYRGRTQFEEPGGGAATTLFGRAEAAQGEYAGRLAAHRAAIRAAAQAAGFVPVLHRTDRAAGPALSLLLAALEERR